jgi:DNA end-binding protein Ku
MSMALTLVDGMTDKWEPKKYQDEYRQALLQVIQEKIAAGGKELPAVPTTRPKPTKVVDLVSVLQQSLNQTKAAKTAKGTSKKKLRKAA